MVILKLLAVAFSEIMGKIFPDPEVDSGAGGTNAICSRPEVANDVISGRNVESFRAVNL